MSSNKKDHGKPMMQLLEPQFLLGIAKALTMGAAKYGPYNWATSQNTPEHDEFVERVKGALLRHLMAYMDGEMVDEESGLSHLYHIGCNLMFMDSYDRAKAESTKHVNDSFSAICPPPRQGIFADDLRREQGSTRDAGYSDQG